jgi:hypothetical protein
MFFVFLVVAVLGGAAALLALLSLIFTLGVAIGVILLIAWIAALIVVGKKLFGVFVHKAPTWRDLPALVLCTIVLSFPGWILFARMGPPALTGTISAFLLGMSLHARIAVSATYVLSVIATIAYKFGESDADDKDGELDRISGAI